ncbi:MAG: ribonuclease III [Clostridia bacterium]|nr:ribonuclease III [Clostridia bacterium]
MHDYPYPIPELEVTLGHTFGRKDILLSALTHSSYANEQRSKGLDTLDNERLEYLGDSVLQLVASEFLYFNYLDLPEGEMSKIRAAAVCEKALCEYASKIELGSYMMLGHGEEKGGGRSRPSILADAFEALLAAIFIDAGIDTVKQFLLPLISVKIKEIVETGSSKDYKTLLQQIVQQEQGEILQYVTVGESGPSHLRTFEVEARLNSNVIGKGTGHSKREAEQMAAKEALTLFGNL